MNTDEHFHGLDMETLFEIVLNTDKNTEIRAAAEATVRVRELTENCRSSDPDTKSVSHRAQN